MSMMPAFYHACKFIANHMNLYGLVMTPVTYNFEASWFSTVMLRITSSAKNDICVEEQFRPSQLTVLPSGYHDRKDSTRTLDLICKY